MSLPVMAAVMDNHSFENTACVLVVSNSSKTATSVDKKLLHFGFNVVSAYDGRLALSMFEAKRIDFILIEADNIDLPIGDLVYTLRACAHESFVPIIALVSIEDVELLSECMAAGCDDFLFKPFTEIALTSRISALEDVRKLKNLYKRSINEQLVARQILAYAIDERNNHFEEIQILSKSKEIFSGDLFLSAKRPDGGLHILLADFTGHGLSAAIGALPAADIFSVMTNKNFELDDILTSINNKLQSLLPINMFMACTVLKMHTGFKYASVWNGGMPKTYLRNSQNGEISNKIKSSHIPLGIDIATRKNFKFETIAISEDDQFIIFTDGLTDAENDTGTMYGYHNLDKCLENNRKQKSVFSIIVAEFNKFCGDIEPNDDVTLACIPCLENMTESNKSDLVSEPRVTNNINVDEN